MKPIFSGIVILFILVLSDSHAFPQCGVEAGSDTAIICGGNVQLNAEPKWEEMNQPVIRYANSIFFTSEDTGYIVGNYTDILKTTDGGITWSNQNVNPNVSVLSVFFTDKNTGFASCSEGTVLKTINGGSFWWDRYIGQNVNLTCICFPSPDTGYMVGSSGKIFKTTNAGETWSQLISGVNTDLQSVYFTDPDTGYAVGMGGTILKTTNGGADWIVQDLGDIPNLNSVHFEDPDTGYIAGYGGVGPKGLIFKTTNGGELWTSQESGIPYSLLSVFFLNCDTGYIAGIAGTVIKTTNGGLDWQVLLTNTYSEFVSLYFPNENTGYVVGNYIADYSSLIMKLSLSGNTFSWSPTEGLNDPNIPNPYANPVTPTRYTVTMTQPGGCTATDSLLVQYKLMDPPVICYVGVQSSNRNTVVWDKPVAEAIDSFYIYRETFQTGIYEKIGAVSYDAISAFTDDSSHADIQSNKYKVSIKDSCGYESLSSIPHKTMHLTINQGLDNVWNLIWEPYEGFPVTTYYIYRGTSSQSLELIGSTSGISTQYSDFKAPQGYVYYQVEVVTPNPCNDRMDEPTVSRSNIATNNPYFGFSDRSREELSFTIIPNPARNIIAVKFPEFSNRDHPFIEIIGSEGRLIRRIPVGAAVGQIDVSDLSAGVYIVRLTTDKGVGVKRMVKE